MDATQQLLQNIHQSLLQVQQNQQSQTNETKQISSRLDGESRLYVENDPDLIHRLALTH